MMPSCRRKMSGKHEGGGMEPEWDQGGEEDRDKCNSGEIRE